MKSGELRKFVVQEIKIVPWFMSMLLVLTGCVTAGVEPGAPGPSSPAAAAINKQIEEFNSTRQPGQGIMPISRRASRVSYDRLNDKVTCYDKRGEAFLVLHRQKDGRYKGVLETPYETWPAPDGSHSWGTVKAEVYLEGRF